MKKNTSFGQNKSIVLTYFKTNKKLIMFFFILWTLIIAGAFTLTTLGLGGTIIANGTTYSGERHEIASENGSSSGSGSSTSGGIISISYIYSLLFNSIGLLFYGLVIVIFINKILIKEVSTTQISIWLTQPISRTQVIMSKLSFLLLLLTIMYLPAFGMLIGFSASAFDAKDLFNSVLIMGIQYYIYIILITLLLFIFSLFFVENGTLFNVVSALFLVYLMAAGILGFLIFDLGNKELLKIKFIPEYLGTQLFMTNVLESNWDKDPIIHMLKFEEIITVNGTQTTTTTIEESLSIIETHKINYFRLISLDLCMLVINGILVWYSNVMFKDKSFNI